MKRITDKQLAEWYGYSRDSIRNFKKDAKMRRRYDALRDYAEKFMSGNTVDSYAVISHEIISGETNKKFFIDKDMAEAARRELSGVGVEVKVEPWKKFLLPGGIEAAESRSGEIMLYKGDNRVAFEFDKDGKLYIYESDGSKTPLPETGES